MAYSFAQDVDLLFNGLILIGDDGTEYGTEGLLSTLYNKPL